MSQFESSRGSRRVPPVADEDGEAVGVACGGPGEPDKETSWKGS